MNRNIFTTHKRLALADYVAAILVAGALVVGLLAYFDVLVP